MVTENYSDDMAYTMPNVDRAYAQAHAALREAPWLNDSGYAHPIATPASAPQNPLDNIADLEVLESMAGMMMENLISLKGDVAGTPGETDVSDAISKLNAALRSKDASSMKMALNNAASVAVSTKSGGTALSQNYKHDEMNELLAQLQEHDKNIREKLANVMDHYEGTDECKKISKLRKNVDAAEEALARAEAEGDQEKIEAARERKLRAYDQMYDQQAAEFEKLKKRAAREGREDLVHDLDDALDENNEAKKQIKAKKHVVDKTYADVPDMSNLDNDERICRNIDRVMQKMTLAEDKKYKELRNGVDGANEMLRIAQEEGNANKIQEAKNNLLEAYENFYDKQPEILKRLKQERLENGDKEAATVINGAIQDSNEAKQIISEARQSQESAKQEANSTTPSADTKNMNNTAAIKLDDTAIGNADLFSFSPNVGGGNAPSGPAATRA